MNKYLNIQKIIPLDKLKELDNAIEEVGSENDYNLIDKVLEEFKLDERLSKEEFYELVKYATFTLDDSDKMTLSKNYNLCSGCANCCSTKELIMLRKDEYERLPKNIQSFISKYDSNFYKINDPKPCPFLTNNNKCSIYTKRPSGCKGYPLVEENGKLIVAKDCDCDLVIEFYKMKVEMFISRININNKISSAKKSNKNE